MFMNCSRLKYESAPPWKENRFSVLARCSNFEAFPGPHMKNDATFKFYGSQITASAGYHEFRLVSAYYYYGCRKTYAFLARSRRHEKPEHWPRGPDNFAAKDTWLQLSDMLLQGRFRIEDGNF